MNDEHKGDRYKRNNGNVIIEIAVKNSRQLFNERDPAPFRERDLDEKFSDYLISAVQEFPLPTKMKIQIESLLYGWWPIREQRRYFDKISTLDVDVVEEHS